ncbi:tetratricopeptide repeat protein [Thermaurantiacus sp.]
MTRSAFVLLAMLLTGAAAPVTTPAPPAKSGAMKRGTADTALAPLSVSLVEKGRTLLAERQYDAAIDRFETALAVDPRNIHAYIGLAEAASGQGLHGKSVRFYREALGIDPNNREALAGQGVALVQRGARPRAEANLERLKILCGGPCPEAARLQMALNAPAPRDNALAATSSPPKP